MESLYWISYIATDLKGRGVIYIQREREQRTLKGRGGGVIMLYLVTDFEELRRWCHYTI